MTVTHAIEQPASEPAAPVFPAGPVFQAGPAFQTGPVYPVGHVHQPAELNRSSRFMLRLYQRAPRWLAPAAIATCFAGVSTAVLLDDPTDNVTTCLVKLTTGLDCPGCGGTRALFYLLRGNIPEAARHHAIALFAAPFLVWLYLAWSIKLVTGRELPKPKITPVMVSGFLIAWAVFMVVRNIPLAPFTYLFV